MEHPICAQLPKKPLKVLLFLITQDMAYRRQTGQGDTVGHPGMIGVIGTQGELYAIDWQVALDVYYDPDNAESVQFFQQCRSWRDVHLSE